MPSLETVFQGLHDSEIRCGIQNEPPAGGITAWMDFGSRTEKATFYGTIAGTAGWTAPARHRAGKIARSARQEGSAREAAEALLIDWAFQARLRKRGKQETIRSPCIGARSKPAPALVVAQ